MSQVRAKFRCDHVTQHAGYGGQPGPREFSFTAQCADEVDENRRFHKATPNGSLKITVDNPAVQFELGKAYYLDFTQAG